MEEIWKSIKGYEGFYEISNRGRIKSLPRTEDTIGRFGPMKRKRNEMFVRPNKRGNYLSIELNKNGVAVKKSIHKLVYEHFIGEIKNGNIIHHIDHDKYNNYVENLKQMDFTEHNNIHKHPAWNKGLKGYMSGPRDLKAYESRRKKVVCIETNEVFSSVNEAAKSINRKANGISRVLKDKNKTTGGFHFEYYK